MKDPELRSCTAGARGLWVDMMCLMFESSQRGYLLINGKSPTETQIGRMAGCDTGEVSSYLKELENAGVFSRNGIGVIYSRRIVRDAEISAVRKKAGRLGGNPNLLNQNASKTQAKRKQNTKQNTTPSSSSSCSSIPKEIEEQEENNILSDIIKEKKSVFKVPEYSEVEAFFVEHCRKNAFQGDPVAMAKDFFYRNESVGWMVGKVKMRRWDMAASRWVTNSSKYSNKTVVKKDLRAIYDAL
jgi:hypothetical protein